MREEVRIGPYVLLDPIAGRSGRVHRALGPDGSSVALELFDADEFAPGFGERFLRDARALARVEHRGIVRVLASGEHEGWLYLATELVEGRTIEAELAARGGDLFELERALALFEEIVAAMAAVHGAGLTHGRIEPDNVLVTSEGRVALVGFALGEAPFAPRTARLPGRTEFLTPEHAKGQQRDARTDVYELGVLLFWLVTGRPPFARRSSQELLRAHATSPRPALASLRLEVPRPFEELAARLMKIEPGERPASAVVVKELLATARREADEAPDDRPAAAGEHAPGTKVGPYAIKAVLGRSALGSVYEAVHESGRACALKLLAKHEAQQPELVKRLLDEGELAVRASHPNLARVVASGLLEDGQPFVEQELVEGRSLARVVSFAGPLEEKLLVAVAKGLARAVHALAQAGVVHRAIRPGAVLLTGDFLAADDAGVKLLDLGLASARHERVPHELGDEQAMRIAPAFLAPEQLADPGACEPSLDLYGLGATLYFAATGRPPFLGSTPGAIVLEQARRARPGVRELNKAISLGMEELIHPLLDFDARHRPSIATVLSELSASQDGRLRSRKVHLKYAPVVKPEEVVVLHAPPAKPLLSPERRLQLAWAVSVALAFTLGLIVGRLAGGT